MRSRELGGGAARERTGLAWQRSAFSFVELSGLSDRVGAIDGTLTVTSPPGEGTLVRAVLPLQIASQA